MSTITSIRAAVVCLGFGATIIAGELGARALIDAGDRSMDENRIPDAVQAYRSAIRVAKSSGDLARAGIGLDHLGIAYNLLGEDRNAETAFTNAISALMAGEEDNTRHLARTWTDLAGLYLKLRRYARAHDVAKRAFAAVKRHTPEDARQTALVLTLLALSDAGRHRTAEAELRGRQAITTLDRGGLSASREWILAANNLASILIGAGRLEQGRTYLVKALACGERVLVTSPDQLVLAQLSANLAHIDLQLHRFEEAGANLQRALDVFEAYLRPDEPRIGEVLVDYARLCRATKRKSEAKQYERRARECLRAPGDAYRVNTVDFSDLLAGRR